MKNRICKYLSLFMVGTLLFGLMTGCGSKDTKETKDTGDAAQELNICIWDGSFSEEAIHDFEKENNCTVNITYIENTDTMISKLVEGGNEYDVCDIEAAYVKSFVDNGLLQEIDHSAIPNGGIIMKKIEVVTRPEKLVGLKEVLASHDCQGMTVYSVMGCGRQKGYLPEMNFTGEDINLLPKIMAFVVVEDDMVEDILADLTTTIHTGKNGDGKIFVTDVLEAVRIRTNERNSDAIG